MKKRDPLEEHIEKERRLLKRPGVQKSSRTRTRREFERIVRAIVKRRGG